MQSFELCCVEIRDLRVAEDMRIRKNKIEAFRVR